MIYEPREDSYLLEKHVKKLAVGRTLDMGAGSGIQALAAKKAASVLASDINLEAVAFVKQKGINAVVSDLFDNIEGAFDTIIFNPPYLPEDEREDKESSLSTTGGKEGSEIIERFLKGSKKHLAKNGQILIVVSSLTRNVFNLFKELGFECAVLEEQHFAFESLILCSLALRAIRQKGLNDAPVAQKCHGSL